LLKKNKNFFSLFVIKKNIYSIMLPNPTFGIPSVYDNGSNTVHEKLRNKLLLRLCSGSFSTRIDEEEKKIEEEAKKDFLKKYHCEVDKLAENVSCGDAEYCQWICDTFKKPWKKFDKEYTVLFYYKRKKGKPAVEFYKKPIGAIIVKNKNNIASKVLNLPRVCDNEPCVIPTRFTNDLDNDEKPYRLYTSEKNNDLPEQTDILYKFCFKPVETAVLFLTVVGSNVILNSYQNEKNLLIMTKLKTWIPYTQLHFTYVFDQERYRTKHNNEIKQVSARLSKINRHFLPQFEYINVGKHCDTAVQNVLLVPQIAQFYAENPCLVTPDVQKILRVQHACYESLVRKTGFFYKLFNLIPINIKIGNDADDDINGYINLTCMKRDNFIINPESFTRKLGSGSYGTVFKVQLINEPNWYAIKFSTDDMENEFDMQKLFNQQDPSFIDEPLYGGSCPYYNKYNNEIGTLHFIITKLYNKESCPTTENCPTDFSRLTRTQISEIANKLEKLNNDGFVHRDIKCNNIMIDFDGNPKLIDFGMASVNLGDNSYKGYDSLMFLVYCCIDDVESQYSFNLAKKYYNMLDSTLIDEIKSIILHALNYNNKVNELFADLAKP